MRLPGSGDTVGRGALAAGLCLEALEVSEVRTSAAQKWASLAKRVGAGGSDSFSLWLPKWNL